MANQVIRKQYLRSATSIGANCCEACEAESKKDFIHKICICKKETKESLYWLGLLLHANKEFEKEIKSLVDEVGEFIKIFSKIVITAKKNSK